MLADITNLHINTYLIGNVILHVTKVLTSTDFSANAILNIQLCLAHDHPRILNSAPFALIQLRTTKVSNFFSVSICPDLSPGEPLWYANYKSEEMDAVLSAGIIQEVLQLALEMNGIPDLHSLIN